MCFASPASALTFGEHALPVVAVQSVGESLIDQRMAVDANAALRITAEAVVALRRVEVIGDEQIEIAVAHPRRRTHNWCSTPASPTPAARVTSVKTPFPAVSIQHVRSVVRDVEVDASIVVDVTGARPHAVVAVTNTRRFRHVAEDALADVAKQTMSCARTHRRVCERTAINEKEIDPAVLVVVEQDARRNPSSRRGTSPRSLR